MSGFVPLGPIPPEMAEQMGLVPPGYAQRSRDLNEMAQLEHAHNDEAFLQSLDAEQRNNMIHLLGHMVAMVDNPAALSYMLGSIIADLKRIDAAKLDVCPVCFKNHEAELHAAFGGETQTMEQAVQEDAPITLEDMLGGRNPFESVILEENAEGFPPPENIDDYPPADPKPTKEERLAAANLRRSDWGGYQCIGCGMPVNSIEDRELGLDGDPSNCKGCQHKAKFG